MIPKAWSERFVRPDIYDAMLGAEKDDCLAYVTNWHSLLSMRSTDIVRYTFKNGTKVAWCRQMQDGWTVLAIADKGSMFDTDVVSEVAFFGRAQWPLDFKSPQDYRRKSPTRGTARTPTEGGYCLGHVGSRKYLLARCTRVVGGEIAEVQVSPDAPSIPVTAHPATRWFDFMKWPEAAESLFGKIAMKPYAYGVLLMWAKREQDRLEANAGEGRKERRERQNKRRQGIRGAEAHAAGPENARLHDERLEDRMRAEVLRLQELRSVEYTKSQMRGDPLPHPEAWEAFTMLTAELQEAEARLADYLRNKAG